MPNTELSGLQLLAIARHAIEARLGLRAADRRENTPATALGASFVTLTHKGDLRGCIGSLEAERPLAEDVAANACAAAFHDPRFPPVDAAEWPEIALEVSVLGAIEWRGCPTLAAALAWIRPGEDGVVLASGSRRATFLPQVWEMLSDAEEFFSALRRKAGLSTAAWPADARIGRYPVLKYREPTGSLAS
ncbi:MAG: AmmeMemoRadiSam system protein A [Betaproteobacteria bacterium]|nr:AmmeMemoRadiSam system protein A [Betaproteobacteria bacterium]